MKYPVKFNLRPGMKDEEIYNEMHGRTAGESRQEVVSFFNPVPPPNSRAVQLKEPFTKYEVVRDWPGEDYALLMRYEFEIPVISGVDKDGNVRHRKGRGEVRAVHYLTGVNDEGKYFVHPLRDISVGTGRLDDLDEILGWLNKADLGFCIRLQGDLVMQLFPKGEYTWRRLDHGWSGRWSGPVMECNIPLPYGLRADFPINQTFAHDDLSHSRSPVREELFKVRYVYLGRHLITTDGAMAAASDHQNLVVDGDTVVAQHPEHGKTEEEIPANHVAVISGQRGRDLSVPDPPESPSGGGAPSKGFD